MAIAHYNLTVACLAPGQMSNPASAQDRHEYLPNSGNFGHTDAMLTLDTWMSAVFKRWCGLSQERETTD